MRLEVEQWFGKAASARVTQVRLTIAGVSNAISLSFICLKGTLNMKHNRICHIFCVPKWVGRQALGAEATGLQMPRPQRRRSSHRGRGAGSVRQTGALCLLGPPVVPFNLLWGEGSPTKIGLSHPFFGGGFP